MEALDPTEAAAMQRVLQSPAFQESYGALATQMAQSEQPSPPLGGIKLPGANEGLVLGEKGVQKAPQGKRVVPEPGFVVKTRSKNDAAAEEAAGGVGLMERQETAAGAKAFVNICVSEAIAKPRTVRRLGEDGEEVEGLSVPVSVGELRRGTDQKGAACHVCDVIVSREVYDEAAEDTSGGQKDFLVGLALQYVEQKYKLQLDPRYKLPRLLYKYGLGEEELAGALDAQTRGAEDTAPPKPVPMAQWIRDEAAAPRIEEVTTTPKRSAPARQAKARPAMPAAVLNGELGLIWGEDMEAIVPAPWPSGPGDVTLLPREERMHRSDGGELPRFLRIVVHGIRAALLDPVQDTEEQIQLDASAFLLAVGAPGHQPLELQLPYAPDLSAGVVAELVDAADPAHPDQLALAVTLPCLIEEWEDAADPGSKAHLLARAIESDDRKESADQEPAEEDGALSPSKADAGSREMARPGLVDRFHLQGQSKDAGSTEAVGVAGLDLQEDDARPVTEDDELPEDRFHRADALSSHYISQRHEEKESRVQKAAEEKATRKSDENVEYVDFDDYKPGGKYGDKLPEAASVPAESKTETARNDRELQAQAARVLQAQVSQRAQPTSDLTQGTGQAKVKPKPRIRNNMWTELL